MREKEETEKTTDNKDGEMSQKRRVKIDGIAGGVKEGSDTEERKREGGHIAHSDTAQ